MHRRCSNHAPTKPVMASLPGREMAMTMVSDTRHQSSIAWFQASIHFQDSLTPPSNSNASQGRGDFLEMLHKRSRRQFPLICKGLWGILLNLFQFQLRESLWWSGVYLKTHCKQYQGVYLCGDLSSYSHGCSTYTVARRNCTWYFCDTPC